MDAPFAALTKLLDSDLRIEAAFVYGSVAKGQQRPDSDLDLAVRFAPDIDRSELLRNQLEFLGKLVLAAGAEVHLCDLDQAAPPLVHAVIGERLAQRGQTRFEPIDILNP